MRALIRRILVIAWMLCALACARFLLDGIDLESFQLSVGFIAATWAAQFILTGMVSPARLLVEAFSRDG